jgi:hypothetical protein
MPVGRCFPFFGGTSSLLMTMIVAVPPQELGDHCVLERDVFFEQRQRAPWILLRGERSAVGLQLGLQLRDA